MKSERAFLHDIASPLAAAMLLLEIHIEDRTAAQSREEIESLQKAFEMLVNLRAMVVARQAEVRMEDAS